MRRNKHIPAHFGTNAARTAQTRYLRGKTPESERVEKNREAAGHVISLCFMVALHDRYGIGKDRLDRVINAANGALERFAVNKRGVGMERAKKKLNEELEGLLAKCPAVKECLVKEKGKKICAVVCCQDQDQQTVRDFITETNRTLPLYKRMSAVEFSAQPLPRNAMGKLMR